MLGCFKLSGDLVHNFAIFTLDTVFMSKVSIFVFVLDSHFAFLSVS